MRRVGARQAAGTAELGRAASRERWRWRCAGGRPGRPRAWAPGSEGDELGRTGGVRRTATTSLGGEAQGGGDALGQAEARTGRSGGKSAVRRGMGGTERNQRWEAAQLAMWVRGRVRPRRGEKKNKIWAEIFFL